MTEPDILSHYCLRSARRRRQILKVMSVSRNMLRERIRKRVPAADQIAGRLREVDYAVEGLYETPRQLRRGGQRLVRLGVVRDPDETQAAKPARGLQRSHFAG